MDIFSSCYILSYKLIVIFCLPEIKINCWEKKSFNFHLLKDKACVIKNCSWFFIKKAEDTKGSRKKNYFLNGSVIKALPTPPPRKLNRSRNLKQKNKTKTVPKKYHNCTCILKGWLFYHFMIPNNLFFILDILFLLKMAGGGQTWQKDAADQNFDYMFKLLIIGNSSVGKTSFLFR